jgi:hypothetical protein
MATPSDKPEASWLRPVYEEKPESLEQYAVCRNCNMIRRDHAEDEKCLFDASTFVARMKSPSK